MSENSCQQSRLETILIRCMEASAKGNIEKTKVGYLFQLHDNNSYIAAVDGETLEFKITTLKWMPGNYEPVEGSELYLSIDLSELEALEEEEIFRRISDVINSLHKGIQEVNK